MADVSDDAILIIIEVVVAADGLITCTRKEALLKLVENAEFDIKRVIF